MATSQSTLLEMTQEILSSLDSDEVSSILDTVEATQVANVIIATYRDLSAILDLPESTGFFELDSPASASTPVQLNIPEHIIRVDRFWYGPVNDENEVKFMLPQLFLDTVLQYDTTETNVSSMELTSQNTSNITFKFYNDRDPEFYTVIEDEHIITNAFDSAVDTFLTKAKSIVFGKWTNEVTLADATTFPLDKNAERLLLNEAKAQAFLELKQMENPKANLRARRLFVQTQYKKDRGPVPTFKNAHTPNYGMRRR